jgi:hypothetical protein
MTIYNVHVYREMRLVFESIEADTPQAAAAIARDKQTSDADEIDDCEGDTFSALVDVQADEDYEQSEVIDFGPRKVVPGMLAACRMVVDRWEHGDVAEAARACASALAEAEAELGLKEITPANARPSDAPPGDDPAKKPFSVLLLYPDAVNDDGTETFYAWVEAPDSVAAIALARRKALVANEWTDDAHGEFIPLLVTAGHRYGLPLAEN